jgi:hypothetical protein
MLWLDWRADPMSKSILRLPSDHADLLMSLKHRILTMIGGLAK